MVLQDLKEGIQAKFLLHGFDEIQAAELIARSMIVSGAVRSVFTSQKSSSLMAPIFQNSLLFYPKKVRR